MDANLRESNLVLNPRSLASIRGGFVVGSVYAARWSLREIFSVLLQQMT